MKQIRCLPDSCIGFYFIVLFWSSSLALLLTNCWNVFIVHVLLNHRFPLVFWSFPSLWCAFLLNCLSTCKITIFQCVFRKLIIFVLFYIWSYISPSCCQKFWNFFNLCFLHITGVQPCLGRGRWQVILQLCTFFLAKIYTGVG